MTRAFGKYLAASCFAAIGLGWVWWSFARNTGGRPSHPHHTQVSESAKLALEEIRLDISPTDETAVADADRAVDRVGELASPSGIEAERIADLKKIFEEAFRNTIAPDFELRCAMMRERGDSWTGPKLESEREDWTQQAELTRNARFGLDQLEIRVLYKGGVPKAPAPLDEGFGALASHPVSGRMPIPSDPVKAHLDIVEVRLPMEKAPAPASGAKGKRPVLVGFQFAWNAKRHQWTPWAICVYADPNEAHYAIHF